MPSNKIKKPYSNLGEAMTLPSLPSVREANRDLATIINSKDFKSALGSLLLQEFSSPDRFVRMLFNALRANPKLSQCDANSVIGAMTLAAAFNLEPNTPSQQCHIIPYKKSYKEGNTWHDRYEAQFQIGYRGFIDIAHRSPRFIELQAEEVHENDHFVRELGTNSRLEFRQALKDRGPMIGAFCYIRYVGKSGIQGEDSTFIDIEELKKIRDSSETWKSLIKRRDDAGDDQYKTNKAEKALNDAAWEKWLGQMAIKSVIKRQFKKFPISPEMRSAAAIDDSAEIGTQSVVSIDAKSAKEVLEGDVSTIVNADVNRVDDNRGSAQEIESEQTNVMFSE